MSKRIKEEDVAPFIPRWWRVCVRQRSGNVEPKSSKPRKTVAAISKALKASELRVLSHAPPVSLSPTLGRGGLLCSEMAGSWTRLVAHGRGKAKQPIKTWSAVAVKRWLKIARPGSVEWTQGHD